MSESEYGYFQIAPFNHSSGNMSIAGRIVGPIIRELIFNEEHHHHHQPHPLSDQIHMKIWRAKYFLPVPGAYLANIEIRYTEFDPENYETSQVYCKDNEIVKEYFWKVVSKGGSASASLQECSSTSMTEGGYWITQVPHILPPKWLPDGGYTLVSARQEYVVKELEDHLFYQPKGCRIKQQSDKFTCQQRNLESLDICFVGDSQIRHLCGTVAGIFLGNSAYFTAKAGNHTTDKTIHSTNRIHCTADDWATMEFTNESRADLARCDAIVVNFGQWHVSWTTRTIIGRGPFTISEYAQLVHRTLHYTDQFPAAKILFVGTMPFGQNAMLYTRPVPHDYRNTAVLRAVNAAGMEACRRLQERKVHCMNLFEMGNVVSDLTYDMAHFKAPVGVQMALAVVTALCNIV
jgi:hypothetical protein